MKWSGSCKTGQLYIPLLLNQSIIFAIEAVALLSDWTAEFWKIGEDFREWAFCVVKTGERPDDEWSAPGWNDWLTLCFHSCRSTRFCSIHCSTRRTGAIAFKFKMFGTTAGQTILLSLSLFFSFACTAAQHCSASTVRSENSFVQLGSLRCTATKREKENSVSHG